MPRGCTLQARQKSSSEELCVQMTVRWNQTVRRLGSPRQEVADMSIRTADVARSTGVHVDGRQERFALKRDRAHHNRHFQIASRVLISGKYPESIRRGPS